MPSTGFSTFLYCSLSNPTCPRFSWNLKRKSYWFNNFCIKIRDWRSAVMYNRIFRSYWHFELCKNVCLSLFYWDLMKILSLPEEDIPWISWPINAICSGFSFTIPAIKNSWKFSKKFLLKWWWIKEAAKYGNNRICCIWYSMTANSSLFDFKVTIVSIVKIKALYRMMGKM